MRHVSADRAAENRERRKVKERSHGPERCQWPAGCTFAAVDWDERLTRGRGGSATDVFNSLLLCRDHHDWKHDHPAEAKALGIMPSAHDRIAYDDEASTLADVAARVMISLRVSAEADEWIDRVAREQQVPRAVVTRALLAVGTGHPSEVVAKVKAMKELD